MNLPITKHSDKRRTLIEWIGDTPVRVCKVIVAKEDCEVGNHYHKHKQDFFYLLSGSASYRVGDMKFKKMKSNECITAMVGEPHTFKLSKGSVLLEATTKAYDPYDEIPYTY